MAGRKVFVGSLPDGVQEDVLRQEFAKYGIIEDIFVKPGAEPGRQWAMVTYTSQAEAQAAKEATDRILTLPGADRPVEVMIARNQNKTGAGTDVPAYSAVPIYAGGGPKKIHVGSLPDSITETLLREEFSKYGQITDLYLKTGCDRHKQWAFITFTSGAEAELAKTSTDRTTMFPGAELPCEVIFARNQGLNGKDPLKPPALPPPTAIVSAAETGPTKIFVGSLPDDISETLLRAEFSRYGQIIDVHLKTGCEKNKQWAFIVFASHSQARSAKDATDRRLIMPGSSLPCEVMFAKYQGKHGSDPLSSTSGSALAPMASAPGAAPGGIPAPPPLNQLPAQYAWRVYQTPQGLAYYHNHTTGVTQWECPPELHYSQNAMQQAQAAHAAQAQQASMYGAMYAVPAATTMYRPY